MIYTFANRTVGLVGNFDTASEIMVLAIQYLGGNVVPMVNKMIRPEVIVIGQNTTSDVMDDIEAVFGSVSEGIKFRHVQIVYEAKIDDHIQGDKLFSDIIDRVKKELPWGRYY